MKYPALTLFSVLLGVFSALAQTENKQREPTSLVELSKQPVCGTRHSAQLDEMVKDQPNNPDFKLQREFCLRVNNDTVYLKVIAVLANLNPKFNAYRLSNLSSLLMKDEITESETYSKSLFAALPNHWFPYAVQTRYKTAQKDYQGAFDSWLKAIELMPLNDNPAAQSDLQFPLWQITFDIHKLMKEKDAPVFYETFFNAAYQRQGKLLVKLKELPSNSSDYKVIRSESEAFGALARSLCVLWTKLAVKLGNPQLESAVLEKMVTTEPRWAGYSQRSAYYQTNGNPKKALADQVRSYELRIELFNEELKQGGTPEQQLNLNNRISDQYSIIGDLYFRDGQYVKAIANYEKAKPFSRYQSAVEAKIAAALRKLNVPEQNPKNQANPRAGNPL